MLLNNSCRNCTDSDSTAVVVESICSCSLSILGSFVIFGTYIFIPEIRNSTRKLVTCLTAADLMTSLGIMASALAHLAGTQMRVCTAQSAITTYSSLVSFYLTVAIAIHIFTTVVYRNDNSSSLKFLVSANVISWVIPAIIIIVAGASGVLGRDTAESVGTGPWCWLKENHNNYALWVFLTGKGWEILCYLITTTLYIFLKYCLFKQKKYRGRDLTEIQESLRDDDKYYLYVWFILYMLRLWGTIRSMMSLAGVDKHSPGDKISNVLMHMQAFGDPAQAFCNCIIVCFFDKTVRSHLLGLCFRPTQIREGVVEEKVHLVKSRHHIYDSFQHSMN